MRVQKDLKKEEEEENSTWGAESTKQSLDNSVESCKEEQRRELEFGQCDRFVFLLAVQV